MKILIFSTAYLPHVGGAELALKEITDRLTDIEFDLITAKLKRGLPDFEKIGNVNVYRVGAGNIFDKPLLPNLGFLKALKFHKKKKYDLIHGIMASQGSAAAYLFKFFYPKVPFVLTLQEGDLGRNSPFDKFWQRRIIKKAGVITAISTYLAEFAKKFNKKAPVFLVPNGVNPSEFNVGKTDRFKDKKVIITVSRLVNKNGVDILVKAMSELSMPNSELWIIGDGSERKKLEKLSQDLEIGDRVKFFGNIPNGKIPEYLAQADVFVRPSRSEGLGTAFLEAMASGTSVIAGYVGGIPDFLKDPSNGLEQATGLFCLPENPKDLAGRIELILSDEILKNKMVENAKRMIEQKYDWDIISQEMKKIYAQTISNYSGI